MEENKNQLYWIIDHEELYWAPGRIHKELDKEIYVQCIIDNEFYSIEKSGAIEVHPTCLEGVPDLLALGDFNEGALLHTIRVRHARQQIYTSIGTPILLSVNPYQKLKIFTTFVARKYRQYSTAIRQGNSNAERPEPHLFMVAEETYQDMLIDNKNQSIIISGESGAGKTEATKIVLCYLAKANTNFNQKEDEDMLDQKKYLVGENNIEKQVLDSNPLLEAFGNAKTFKNNNSSRFGKFIQVNFEPSGKIHSASIINYLLEKSRIVFQQGVERNFHIFYQIMSSPEMTKKYNLLSMDSYHYINQSGVYKVNDVNDGEDFKTTKKCMENIGFTLDEINQVLDMTVAILLLGNIEFESVAKQGSGDTAAVAKSSLQLLSQIANLLQLTQDALSKTLTVKVQVIGKDVIPTPLNKENAYHTRDALAKIIYGKLFNWLVKRINVSISEKMKAKVGQKLKFIGLLDIFGFEIFKENSFEQLCINYANEKLQQQFNQHMFTLEQEEYKKENVQWTQIKFVDNQDCIDLFESMKAPSLFKLLDEESMRNGTENALLKKYNDMLQSNKKFKRPNKFGATSFIVCHYAGQVEYEINSFLEKNKDAVSESITDSLSQSKQAILSELFQKDPQEVQQVQAQGKNAPLQIKSAGQGGSLKGNSLSNQFKTQLNELILILKESQPRYIRCIKPNSLFSPTAFDSNDVGKQLSCAGMLEAIRIRKAGYAIRTSQEDFGKRYRAILGKKKRNESNNKQLCELIIQEVTKLPQFKKIFDPSLKKIQIGNTKVFMKEEVRTALEQAMGLAVLLQAVQIQKLFRGFKARKLFRLMKKSMGLIKHHLRKFIRRRKFRKAIMLMITKLRKSVRRLQKVFKWRCRHKKIMRNVAQRIERKKREAEEKRRKEEEQRRREEEQRRKEEELRLKQENERKMREERERIQSQQKQRTQNDSQFQQQDQSLPIEDDFAVTQIENSFSFQMDTSQNQYEGHRSNLRSDSNIARQMQQESQSYKHDKQMPSRFQQNINRLEQFVYNDGENSDKIIQLEQEVAKFLKENNDLKQELQRLKQENDEKDKKIRELNIRLEARGKYAKKEIDSQGFPNDLSQIGLSFATTAEDRMSLFPRNTNQKDLGNVISQEFEKLLESKDEEILQLKTKLELLEADLKSKDENIESLKEDHENLQTQNKKWKGKLDEEIEKNAQNIGKLTKQIKELQEKNYKLEFESKQMLNDLERKAFKDQTEEIKRLENLLRNKADQIEELEMQRFNLQEGFAKEHSALQQQLDEYKRLFKDLDDQNQKRKVELEELEVQLIQKDEMAKDYEEQNLLLTEQIKQLYSRFEQYGEDRSAFIENLENERSQTSQTSSRIKELQRELDKVKGMEKVKQAELDRFKEQCDKQKRKIKEQEEENEQLLEKVHQLKKEKGQVESEIVLYNDKGVDGFEGGDYEKQKLRQKVEQLQNKIQKKRDKMKKLDRENNFYHQITTIFLTIKKVIEKEKKFCFLMAQETDVLKKRQIMDGINMCREKSRQLDNKLKKILILTKELNEVPVAVQNQLSTSMISQGSSSSASKAQTRQRRKYQDEDQDKRISAIKNMHE